MFTNVLKKFFTGRFGYENKTTTGVREAAMAKQVKQVLATPAAQMAGDALGVVSLIVILWGGLTLPALF
jgi:hypothetical protein